MSQHYKEKLEQRLKLAQWKLNCNKAMRSRGKRGKRGDISDDDKIYLELMADEHETECKDLAREYENMTGETVAIGYGIEEKAE